MSELDDRKVYWLTQRMRRRGDFDPSARFDENWALDYMGSSEYEWGAAHRSLGAMLAESWRSDFGVHRVAVDATKGQARTRNQVFFVCRKIHVAELARIMPTWLEEDRWKGSKELSYFPDQFFGTASEYQSNTQAWWPLGYGLWRGENVEGYRPCFFALDHAVAEDLAANIAVLTPKRSLGQRVADLLRRWP